MPRKNLYRRILVLVLCAVFVSCLACLAFAEPVDLDYQYVFSVDFTFSDIERYGASTWYYIPLDLSSVADKVNADYVIFTIDNYEYKCKWKDSNRGAGYYLGNASYVFGLDDGSEFPFLLSVFPNDLSHCTLYLTEPIIGPLYHGDKESLHVAISVAYNDPMTTGSLMDDTSTVFGSTISMVGSVARTVTSNPILFLPIVISLCGIGVAFFRRLKQ